MQVTRRLELTFPTDVLDKPVVYRLIRDFDLVFNILRASVTQEETGRMAIELTGSREVIKKGVEYLRSAGVGVERIHQEVLWDEELCTQCTACTSVCPTKALPLDRKTFRMSFDGDKCIACGLCIRVCPYRALRFVE